MDLIVNPDRLRLVWKHRLWITLTGIVGALLVLAVVASESRNEPFRASIFVSLRDGLPDDRQKLVLTAFQSDAVAGAVWQEAGAELTALGYAPHDLRKRVTAVIEGAPDWVRATPTRSGKVRQVITITARGASAAAAERVAALWARHGTALANDTAVSKAGAQSTADGHPYEVLQAYLAAQRELDEFLTAPHRVEYRRRIAQNERFLDELADSRAAIVLRASEGHSGPEAIREALATYDRSTADLWLAAEVALQDAQRAQAADAGHQKELEQRRDALRQLHVQAVAQAERAAIQVQVAQGTVAVISNSLRTGAQNTSWRTLALAFAAGGMLACTAAAVLIFLLGNSGVPARVLAHPVAAAAQTLAPR